MTSSGEVLVAEVESGTHPDSPDAPPDAPPDEGAESASSCKRPLSPNDDTLEAPPPKSGRGLVVEEGSSVARGTSGRLSTSNFTVFFSSGDPLVVGGVEE